MRWQAERVTCHAPAALDRWWGITFAKAAKLTGDKAYLRTAKDIFYYLKGIAVTPSCGGGLRWAAFGEPSFVPKGYKATVANQLYMALAMQVSCWLPRASRRVQPS